MRYTDDVNIFYFNILTEKIGGLLCEWGCYKIISWRCSWVLMGSWRLSRDALGILFMRFRGEY